MTEFKAKWVVLAIMVAVLAWGVLHAVGAFLLNHDPRRPLVVLSCVLAFLGVWVLLLRNRRNAMARKRPQAKSGPEQPTV